MGTDRPRAIGHSTGGSEYQGPGKPTKSHRQRPVSTIGCNSMEDTERYGRGKDGDMKKINVRTALEINIGIILLGVGFLIGYWAGAQYVLSNL
jgi:hypothetical protein